MGMDAPVRRTMAKTRCESQFKSEIVAKFTQFTQGITLVLRFGVHVPSCGFAVCQVL